MARSEVTVATRSINAAVAITKDAIDISNDHSIDVSGLKDQDLDIYIETTSTVAATFSIAAGDYSEACQGALSIATAAAGVKVVRVESARFKYSDELILIDITSTGVTGNIWAVAGA